MSAAGYDLYFDPEKAKWVIEHKGKAIYAHSVHETAKAKLDQFIGNVGTLSTGVATVAAIGPETANVAREVEDMKAQPWPAVIASAVLILFVGVLNVAGLAGWVVEFRVKPECLIERPAP